MSALLACEGVSVSRDGRLVLRDASFSLYPGERLAILGPNGAGKTTLLRTLMGLERAEAGRVRLFDAECRDEPAFRAQRPRIGYLFQDSDDQLFCPTVIEDVAFGPLNLGCTNDEALRRAGDVLEQLGIGALAERVTHRLSGGEKRLVCLAGLLAMAPRVLILDEPTNGVDAENGNLLRAALCRFPGAILMVSHDSGFIAELATRALVIRDRRLVPADELVSS
jgi:cobalt/nickel transport system ATP-binding protein